MYLGKQLVSATNTAKLLNAAVSMSTNAVGKMNSFGVRAAKVSYPSGDPNFSVMQAFPSGFTAEESDPFLMLDDFGPEVAKAPVSEDTPDIFPLGWHPHRGMSVITYMTRGVGRHGDSMGNRESFEAPGMQWVTAGSGIEHAEGGGTPLGEWMQGFQIWVNLPAKHKMADPVYGTEPPGSLPLLKFGKDGVDGSARLLAGPMNGQMGPLKTQARIQMVDFVLPVIEGHKAVDHILPPGLDNVLIYVYSGSARINGELVPDKHVIRLEPTEASRTLTLQAADDAPEVTTDTGFGTGHAVKMLLFAGKKLNEPIAWHGPIVMNTQNELRTAFREYHEGTFLKKRFPGDYKSKAEIDRITAELKAKGTADEGGAKEKTPEEKVKDNTKINAGVTQCAVDAK